MTHHQALAVARLMVAHSFLSACPLAICTAGALSVVFVGIDARHEFRISKSGEIESRRTI